MARHDELMRACTFAYTPPGAQPGREALIAFAILVIVVLEILCIDWKVTHRSAATRQSTIVRLRPVASIE
jgi:hypothetical protein